MPFNSPEGNLEDIFVNDYAMIDQFANVESLWSAGLNYYGQLADNTNIDKSSPVQAIGASVAWNTVSCGGNFTAALKTDSTLWLWGQNNRGQLGNSTITDRSSPVQTISGGTNWKQVACGYSFSAAIKTDGTLWLWGYNYYGQLGDTTRNTRLSPIQTVAGGSSWKQVACGYGHVAAIKTDGTLWSWGNNLYGQLGDNTTANKSSPVQTVTSGTDWKSVACGVNHTAAIKTDGTLWLWGSNVYGQLGDNTTTRRSSPVQIISGGNDWKQVACGEFHTTAIKTDGTLWAWGQGDSGQLGDNTTVNKSSPVQTVAGGTDWKQVASGGFQNAAIKTDGTLWTWGYNFYGQLGDNTKTNKSSPVQTIAGGTIWKQPASGKYHFAALRDRLTG